jgi:nucleoside-diphosphate-sugar epimerase
MRYAVTGAAGFVGSHLAEALVSGGHEVVAIDSFTDYYDPALKEENVNAAGLDVARLDLGEEPLDLDGVDGVFHLAAQPGVRTSWGDDFDVYVKRNVLATRHVLEAALTAGARVVLASSSSVYGDAESFPTREDAVPRPISPYGVTKLAAEHLAYAYARSDRLDCVVLRYFTIYGPRQRPDMAFARMLNALAESRPFTLYGDGSQSRDFTYVGDAVTAAVAAMKRAPAGAVYNVGGGSEATMRDAIEVVERVARAQLELDRQPAAAGDARRTSADTTRVRSELGWTPQTTLERGLQAQWEWLTTRLRSETAAVGKGSGETERFPPEGQRRGLAGETWVSPAGASRKASDGLVGLPPDEHGDPAALS